MHPLRPRTQVQRHADPATDGGLTKGFDGNIVGKDCGTSILSLAAILDPTLRNNGGATFTHALVPGSAAIVWG
jgi:hypothetical protein